MKWPLTIAICIFACVSFSSSVPIFIQDDMALMYPMEYYPGYLQTDFVNLDIAKWFRKATDSVKHLYNYVNNLIFGNGETEPIFGRHPTLKEDEKPETDSNDANTHPTEQNANLPRVQAFEVYKDSDGKYIVKSLTNENGHVQISEDNTIKSGVKLDEPVKFLLNDDPMFRRINDKIAKYPLRWNEKFEKDELFSGAFQNNDMNPELLWHSGIFPFQPMNAFNVLGEQASIQNQPSQSPSDSEELKSNEISDQNIGQSDPSTYSPSTTDQVEITSDKITEEETQHDETSGSSNDEKKSNEDSRPYEIVMEVERIKQNHSHSESNSNTESDSNSKSDKTNNDDETDSDAFQNNSVMPDGITDDEWDGTDDEDDKNNELTDSEYIQPSSDDDSNQNNPEPSHESHQNYEEAETSKKSIPDVTNGGDDNTTIPSEGIEKAKITEITKKIPDADRIAKIFEKPNSDESDIAERVLAMVQPSEN